MEVSFGEQATRKPRNGVLNKRLNSKSCECNAMQANSIESIERKVVYKKYSIK